MIKCVVEKSFTLKKFNELKNLVRSNEEKNEKGKLFKGDVFECDETLAKYLTGDNKEGIVAVRILEVIPEEVKKEVVEEIKEVKTEVRPKANKKNFRKKKA